jgi:hypothetical protein
MSTTSGSTSFNLDLVNLIEEAYERCGQEMKTGYDMRTARRSLNIMTIEWANRGINLWTIEQGFIETNPMSHEGSTLCAKSLNKDRGNHPSRRMIGATSLT